MRSSSGNSFLISLIRYDEFAEGTALQLLISDPEDLPIELTGTVAARRDRNDGPKPPGFDVTFTPGRVRDQLISTPVLRSTKCACPASSAPGASTTP